LSWRRNCVPRRPISQAAEPSLRFFLDRGLGAFIVPTALRAAGWVLETMDERYGKQESQNISDVRWIEEATNNGDILLCKDLRIAKNPLEAEVIDRVAARAFGLKNRNVAGQTMVAHLLENQGAIFQMALRAEGPYVVAVDASDAARPLRRLRLNRP